MIVSLAYNRDDVDNVDLLVEKMEDITPKWYFDVEKPVTNILFKMEQHGCPLDKNHLENLNKLYTIEASRLYEEITKDCPKDFNPGSTDQLAGVLSSKGYDLKRICKKTPKGAYQLDKEFFKKLAWKGDKYAKVSLSIAGSRKSYPLILNLLSKALTQMDESMVVSTSVVPKTFTGTGDGQLIRAAYQVQVPTFKTSPQELKKERPSEKPLSRSQAVICLYQTFRKSSLDLWLTIRKALNF